MIQWNSNKLRRRVKKSDFSSLIQSFSREKTHLSQKLKMDFYPQHFNSINVSSWDCRDAGGSKRGEGGNFPFQNEETIEKNAFLTKFLGESAKKKKRKKINNLREFWISPPKKVLWNHPCAKIVTADQIIIGNIFRMNVSEESNIGNSTTWTWNVSITEPSTQLLYQPGPFSWN